MNALAHNAEMYEPSNGWGSRGGHSVHAPQHPVEACRDVQPVSAGPLFDDLLPVNSAGLHGSAILSNSHPQRVPSPYLRCHGRQVERIAPCRFRVPSNFRLQFSAHAVQSHFADLPERHLPVSVVAGFDIQKPSAAGGQYFGNARQDGAA